MNQTVIYLLFGGLMAWSVYRRMRRNIGRQRLRPRRIIIRLVIMCAVSGLLLFAGLQMPRILLGFGAGLLAGALLGLVGLRLTQFETTEEGHFYIPDTRIGVGLTLLLVGRVIYRSIVLTHSPMGPGHPPAMQSPLTFLIIGITFGYYIVYLVGLLVHTHDKTSLPPGGSL